MRTIPRIAAAALVALALNGCKTAPPPAPPPPPPPAPVKPAEPALTLTGLSTASQSLEAVTLNLAGTVGAEATGRTLSLKVTSGETVLASGTAALEKTGTFEVPVTVPFGRTPAELQPWQGSETQQLVVEASLANGDQAVTETRALTVRSPLLPSASIINVQGSKDKDLLDVTARLKVKNPNPFDLKAGNLHYVFTIWGKTVLEDDVPVAGRLPGSSENEFELPAQANVKTHGKEITKLLKGPEAPWTFKGTFKADGLELPVDLAGTLKLSK